MLGNVWEWTSSIYQEVYDGSEMKCVELEDPGLRVFRGGSWTDEPKYARSANRHKGNFSFKNGCIGFRLAHD